MRWIFFFKSYDSFSFLCIIKKTNALIAINVGHMLMIGTPHFAVQHYAEKVLFGQETAIDVDDSYV